MRRRLDFQSDRVKTYAFDGRIENPSYRPQTRPSTAPESQGRRIETLTKSKQREYALYIADAKREETKARRIKKIIPMIAAGQGLHDKYRNC